MALLYTSMVFSLAVPYGVNDKMRQLSGRKLYLVPFFVHPLSINYTTHLVCDHLEQMLYSVHVGLYFVRFVLVRSNLNIT